VPGRWKVHHYWEVEDGYAVEQCIFGRLSTHRLERQEFFRMTPEQAMVVISSELKIVGTNPIEKTRLAEESKEREAQELRSRIALEEEQKRVERRRLEMRRDKIIKQIELAQNPIREASHRKSEAQWDAFFRVCIFFMGCVFFFGFYNAKEPGVLPGIRSGSGFVIAIVLIYLTFCFVLTPILAKYRRNHSKSPAPPSELDLKLQRIEDRILAANGCKSRKDLEIPTDLQRRF
jgi:hypothetical protein